MAPTLQRLRQSVLVHAPPEAVYEALLDGPTLSRIFGRPVHAAAVRGGEVQLLGLIHCTNLELEPGRRIVQSFRYALPDWPLEHTSKVTLQFKPVPDGTRVVLDQSGIPAACAPQVQEHWFDHVWPGLKSILASRGVRNAPAAAPRARVRLLR